MSPPHNNNNSNKVNNNSPHHNNNYKSPHSLKITTVNLPPRKSPVPLNSHTGPGPLSPSGRGPLPTPKANAAVPGNRPLPVANSGTYIQTDIDTLRHRYILTYTYTHTCDTHTQHR